MSNKFTNNESFILMPRQWVRTMYFGRAVLVTGIFAPVKYTSTGVLLRQWMTPEELNFRSNEKPWKTVHSSGSLWEDSHDQNQSHLFQINLLEDGTNVPQVPSATSKMIYHFQNTYYYIL